MRLNTISLKRTKSGESKLKNTNWKRPVASEMLARMALLLVKLY